MAATSADWGEFLASQIPPRWREVLPPSAVDQVRHIGHLLSERSEVERISPAPHQVFRALSVDPDAVSVLVIGQDPYPHPDHAMGLAFSVPRSITRLPPSAVNIRKELASDLEINLPAHFELTSWVDQGVLLINRHLTTAAFSPGAHQHLGWEVVTNEIVRAVVAHSPHLVAILWGKHAASVTGLLGTTPRIESAHPSPLSAHRGFWGSRPFSRVNALRDQQGLPPIDWALD